jgi:hypothetical protein
MRERKILLCFTLVFLVLVGSSGQVSGLSYPKSFVGQDISWPNCHNLKFAPSWFGIVGVNGGLNFHVNPCLGSEASLYRNNLSLYVNTGFPGMPYDLKYQTSPLDCARSDSYCLAYNYGYNAGKYAANYALSRGVVSNNWWLDVETINSWSGDYLVNKASLIGEVNAINGSVKPTLIGYYSYPTQWTDVTGGWQNGYPSWLATNSNFKTVAENECSEYSFNSGSVFMTQYIGKIDFDLAC